MNDRDPLKPSSDASTGASAGSIAMIDDRQARRVAIVANPFSGARRNHEVVGKLIAALASHQLESHEIRHLDELAAVRSPETAGQYRCVVAAGGDGTLHRVLNERLPLPVAVLPLGNENLFARHFGFDREPEAIAEAIAAGRTRPIDLGSVNGQLFSIVVSAGFDGEVVHRLAEWRSRGHQLRRVNSRAYVAPLLAAACSYQYPTVEVQADDQTVRGALAMVFNLPIYGLRLQFAPDACCDDGWLDWVVFTRPGRLPLVGYALSVLLGRHQARSDVIHGRCRQLTMTSAARVPVEVDGEAAGHTPLTIEAVPRAARVIVPTDAGG
ncbi:MAG TPA: diacylglycerol kinase family protein [Pirellulales bacterium]